MTWRGQRPWLEALRNNSVLIAFILLVVVLAFIAPYFLTKRNLLNILLQASPFVMLALGELAVVLVAGIDLSVGSMLGFGGALVAFFIVPMGIPWFLAIPLMLLCTAVLGVIQGIFINYFNVSDFVGTLAGLSIFRGLTLVMTQGRPIHGLPEAFNFIGQGRLLGIPFPVFIMAAIFLLVLYWLSQSVTGTRIYAIGGSRTAAHRAGIKVARVRALMYGFSGLMAGTSGIIITARLGSAEPTAGTGGELTAIAAVVIGGVSLFGGRGNAWGALLGALIITTILNGLILLNVPPFYTQMVEGLVILAAVLLENLRRRQAS